MREEREDYIDHNQKQVLLDAFQPRTTEFVGQKKKCSFNCRPKK